ncbi:MAG: ABC transporter permease [Firmicutes bacterium]|nr:ABC transporter permease [Bacillota bacterium]
MSIELTRAKGTCGIDSYRKILSYFREKPLVTVACLILLLIAMSAIFALWVAPKDPYQMEIRSRLKPIGTPGFPLGTDSYGRDILSRVIWAGRTSLLAGVVPAFIAMSFGVLLGLLSGYWGGWFDRIVMAVVDIMLSFPFMLLAIALVAALGPSLQNAMIAVIVATVPARIRLIRGETLSIKEASFIDAARVLGYGDLRIIFSEILPNVMAIAMTAMSMDIPLMISATAGLSFLGLGVQPPQADWGTMVSDGKNFIMIAPHVTLVPSAVLLIVTLCFAIIGDAVRVIFNPKARDE